MNTISLVVALTLGVLPSSAANGRVQYVATGETQFAFSFKTFSTSHIKVYLGGGLQSAGYSVSLYANQDSSPGGTVTFLSAPANGTVVKIERTLPVSNDSVWSSFSKAKSLELDLDRGAMRDQQLQRNIDDVSTGVLTAGDASAVQITATGSTTSRAFRDRFSDVVNVKDFGAKGDGTTDDTAAIQAAIDAAAVLGRGVIIPPSSGAYPVSQIILKPGMPFFRGTGGTLKVNAYAVAGNVVLGGVANGLASNIDGMEVSGLVIDADSKSSYTIRGNSVQKCRITDNYIYNQSPGTLSPAAMGIALRAPDAGGRDAAYNLIARNTIVAPTPWATDEQGGKANHLISLSGDADYVGTYTSPTDQWRGSFTAVTSTYAPSHNVVTGNVLIGGYYGVDVALGASHNLVTANRIHSTIRGVSLQHSTNFNEVTGNRISDTDSSGVHVAYSASDNFISGNFIQTARGYNGEAMLQLYIGAKRNVFRGNEVISADDPHGGNSQFLTYVGPMCDGTVIEDNRLYGKPQRAAVAIEPAWLSTDSNPASYAYGKGATVDGFSNAGLSNVVIRGNVITHTNNGTVPAIYLSQVTDTLGVHGLSGVIVSGNVVTNAGRQMETTEADPGNLTTLSLVGNAFYQGAGPTHFVLARGRAPFIHSIGNTVVDDGYVSTAAGDATPSVAVGRTFALPQETLTVTNFDDGMEGQEITVRLAIGVTIAHNASLIRLKGATNISGQDASAFVRLARLGAIWMEQYRNF